MGIFIPSIQLGIWTDARIVLPRSQKFIKNIEKSTTNFHNVKNMEKSTTNYYNVKNMEKSTTDFHNVKNIEKSTTDFHNG